MSYTPHYRAPETLDDSCGYCTDVYSAGIVFCYLLVLEHNFNEQPTENLDWNYKKLSSYDFLT